MNTQFQKGHIPWSKGKKIPHSEGHKKAISLGRKGKCLGNKHGFKKGHLPWNKGKRCPGIGGRPSGGTSWTKGLCGENHPCYKEKKKHPFYKLIRETFKYRQWRSDIFTRDEFICVICGVKGVELNADHYPKRFIDIINEYRIKTLEEASGCEELWNINNGRTLCVKCHCQTDTWGNKRPFKIFSN